MFSPTKEIKRFGWLGGLLLAWLVYSALFTFHGVIALVFMAVLAYILLKH